MEHVSCLLLMSEFDPMLKSILSLELSVPLTPRWSTVEMLSAGANGASCPSNNKCKARLVNFSGELDLISSFYTSFSS